MSKKGNPNHKEAGTPEGGQFTTKYDGTLIRTTPVENDIQSYTKKDIFGNDDPERQEERIENINKALYDGGYLDKCGSELNGFESAEEAEEFLTSITNNQSSRFAWEDRKELVETYVRVVKGYLQKNDFHLVGDGEYSATGAPRKATELLREFGWVKKDVREKLLESLTADDFLNSGASYSRYTCNDGTVVMVFAPQINATKQIVGEDGRLKRQKLEIDLYVKLVLNPHPGRGQSVMNVLSFKEAERKKCLYTKKFRNGRREIE